MTTYTIGEESETIDEGVLTEHVLITGGSGMGKTHLLMQFAKEQLGMGRCLSLFDSGGELYDYVVAVLAQKDDSDAELLDTSQKEWIFGFNPLKPSLLSAEQHVNRLSDVVLEAAMREGVDLNSYEQKNPIGGVEYVINKVIRPGHYFYYSLSQKENAVDFKEVIGRKKFLAKIIREDGSRIYGMMLFDSLLMAAQIKPQKELNLVLIDGCLDFFGGVSLATMEELTVNNIALVVVCSYKDLAWIKENDNGLYQTMLDDFGSLIAFGGSEDDPYDVIQDVAERQQR